MRGYLASLRVRFVILAIFTVLPALGLLFYTVNEQRDLAVEAAQQNAQRLANLAAADQELQIDNSRQLLTVLARLPEVHSLDPAPCTTLLQSLRAMYDIYANLGVVTPGGSLVCAARMPETGTLDLSDRDYIQEAIESREFSCGAYQVGRVTGVASINCAYPVQTEAGELLAVVYAAIDLAGLNRFAAEGPLPDDSVLTVFDRSGTVLVRYPDGQEWLGRSLIGTPVVDQILSEGEGITEAPGIEGRPYLFAYTTLGDDLSPNGYLSIAVPRASAVATANEAFDDNLAWLGLVTALALVAAWVGGDLLVQRDSEANKTIVRRMYDAFTSGTVDQLDEVVDHDFVDHDPLPGQAPGLLGLRQAVGFFRAAFPDGRLEIDDLIAEGDKVVAHIRVTGTQVGAFRDIPPSAEAVTAEGVETFRINRGKIVEGWSSFGRLTPDENGVPTAPPPERVATGQSGHDDSA